MDVFMGIDIGSQQSKGVLLQDDAILAHMSVPSGIDHRKTAHLLRDGLSMKLGRKPAVAFTVATGCGADNVDFADDRVGDIQCSARGMNFISKPVRTLIEVGARSTRVIRISDSGKVTKFAVTDKCAAGSGVFLQIVANVLRIDLREVGPLSLKSNAPVTFNTGCAVFGETEAITRVSEGIPKEDILAGVHKALAEKIYALLVKVELEPEVALAGGGGLDVGLAKRLGDKLGVPLTVPAHPDLVGAVGAAVSARTGFMRTGTAAAPIPVIGSSLSL